MVALWRNGRRYHVMDWAEKANAEYSPVQVQVLPEQFFIRNIYYELHRLNHRANITKPSLLQLRLNHRGLHL